MIKRICILGALFMIAVAGILVLSPAAYSADVEHIILEAEDSLGIPEIQALIAGCIGEEVYFTGTIKITLKDGIPTHYNWAGMRGETLDGDLFIGGSSVNVGQQSNLTLVEVGANKNNRRFRLHTVADKISVSCDLPD